ncbi:MAG: DNA polymerase I [Dehalococcoidia bacterium]
MSPANTADKPLLLVMDGHAMVFRAWFSIPERLSTATGDDTRGAYGFLTTFLKVVRERKPTHVAVAFDTRAPTFRDDLFPEYKAQRPPTPDDLHAQVPMVKQIMQAFRVPIFEKDGFEADDLVGTISRTATAKGIETLILTGDADQLQLVSPDVKLLMYSGFADTRVYDVEAVKERYNGLGPEFVPDIKALEGDPSDNIPGVPGVGKKAAAAVLAAFGHLEEVYENIDKVDQIDGLRGAKRVRTLLEEHRDVAFAGRKLTTIVCDVPIEFDLDKAKFWQYDRSEVVETLLGLEFRSIVAQVPEPGNGSEKPALDSQLTFGAEDPAAQDQSAASPVNEQPDNVDYRTVTTMDELKSMVKAISTPTGFAFDTETSGMNPMRSDLVGLSFSNEPGKAWYVPVGHEEGEQLPLEEVLAVLRPLFEDENVPKSAHNANFDLMVLAEAGIEPKNVAFDSMIAAALCGRRAIGLKQLALDAFRLEMTPITDLIGTGRKQISMAQVPVEQAAPYASADADVAWQLKDYLDPELEREGQRKVLGDIEMPLLPVIVRMQRNGILIDRSVLSEMSEELAGELAAVEKTAREIMGGREFNLASNQQIAAILIEELGAPKTRRTKTGYSMDANALEGMLAREDLDVRAYELIKAVLRYRELSKLKSTYVDALPQLVNPKTGRVHTSFNQVGSATGRLSSTDPNVQNIPVRTELGRRVRTAFIADSGAGWTLLAADYSQIELRILAHLSQEPGLLAAFKNGEDIHAATARTMYGQEVVTAEQRRIAKVLNFGVIYGLSAHGVTMQTDLTRKQGQEFIDLYFGKYPGIRDYIEAVKSEARDRGYVETVTGRRRRLPELRSNNHMHRAAAERMAINMPVQGTAADVIKIAMVDIDNEMRRQKVRSRMAIQVHDELIFEVAPGELEEMTGMVTELMPAAMNLSVPLDVELKQGKTWGHLE